MDPRTSDGNVSFPGLLMANGVRLCSVPCSVDALGFEPLETVNVLKFLYIFI